MGLASLAIFKAKTCQFGKFLGILQLCDEVSGVYPMSFMLCFQSAELEENGTGKHEA
jgi:hypothetical protein